MNDKYKNNFKLAPSPIHGTGTFANKLIPRKHIIGVCIYHILLMPFITDDFGKWINHSYNPNSIVHYNEKNNKYYIVAIKDINPDEEITINYNHTPWFIKKAQSHYK
ncbi:SET domain-containing protein [Fadolivirus algeromassiliense]|jgi:hypothetical protein|uniref:SET domain-containing protein n=1 Tax=Fadolivirus FV1/VV64 TaxID=3070911 RepID=A0A7D3QWK1_9VIRU|nr:SET domain-containing protein [Fadolivirus algeromassiliense]QKF94639.1 SET domain-containing protein [Fadolivirus FV1/VV64]